MLKVQGHNTKWVLLAILLIASVASSPMLGFASEARETKVLEELLDSDLFEDNINLDFDPSHLLCSNPILDEPTWYSDLCLPHFGFGPRVHCQSVSQRAPPIINL
jgi:hypothetical protein